jgi:hypothetical protein
MELNGQHLLPIVLVGCKELDRKLGGHANQCLSQLIDMKLCINSLTPAETIDYIDHRLGKVRSSFEACFADDCSDQLFAKTGGCPCQINQVCHQALEDCMQENLPWVTREILWGMEQEHPQETQDLRKKRGLSKKAGAVLAAAFVTVLAIYAIRKGPDIKAPIPATDISVTQLKEMQTASTVSTPAAPITAALTSDQDKTHPNSVDQPELFPPPPPPSRKSGASQQPHEGGIALAPLPENQAAGLKTSTSTTYKVTPEDLNLTKIAAKHYKDKKAIGFVAIILANPQLTDEDSIFPGQELLLPKVKPNEKVIILNDNLHYLLYNRYSDISLVKKTLSKLTERKVRFQVRETHNIDAGNIYRLFLGGYEREEDLTAALAVTERE